MLSGCPLSDRGASSALDQQWSNVDTLAPALMVTIQSRPPSTSGVYNMVCDPPHGLHGFSLAHASETSVKTSDGQRRQMPKASILNHKNEHHQRQSSNSRSSSLDSNHINSSHNIPSKKSHIEAKHPLLHKLLLNNDRKDVSQSNQQSKRTSQPSVSTSASSAGIRALQTGRKPCLDDDQILCLIANKLSEYRTQMNSLLEKHNKCTAKDSLKLNRPQSDCVPQAIITGTSNSSALGKALEDNSGISKDKETSAGKRQESETSMVKDSSAASATAKQPQGTLIPNSSHDMQYVEKNTDYFDLPVKTKDFSIDQQWTHMNSKDKYGRTDFLGNVGTLHYSLTALKELVSSIDNVPMSAASVDNSFDEIVHQYWNGKMDNVHLFTSTEYVRIMQEAAAVCAKTEGQSPVVLTTLSGTTVEELTMRNPLLTMHCKPSDEEYKSAWRNVNNNLNTDKEGGFNRLRNIMKKVDNVPASSESSKARSVPTSSTLKSQPVNAKEKQQKYAAGSENATVDSTIDKVLNNTEGLKQKPHWQEPSEQIQTQEKVVQAGFGKIEQQFTSCMMEHSGPRYDNMVPDAMPQTSTLDISAFEGVRNDESPVLRAIKHLPQLEPTKEIPPDTQTHSMSQMPQTDMSLQFEDISEDESPIPYSADYEDISDVESSGSSEQITDDVETEPEQPPEQLTCSCPYFVETQDGFEEKLCPKCVQDEDEPESDEEWTVIPLVASEVTLLQEINYTDNGDEENQDASSAAQDSRPSSPCFKKIPVYETWEDFLAEMNKSFPKPLKASDNPPNVLDSLPLECALRSEEAEDSCDTEDSCDYPLQTKHNYLTVSGPLKGPSPLPHNSDSSEEEDEMPSTSEATTTRSKPISDWFPDLSSDDDEEDEEDDEEEEDEGSSSTNQVPAVESVVNVKPVNEETQEKPQTGKKSKFKSRVIYSDSETDDESNIHCSRTRKTSLLNEQNKLSSGPGTGKTAQNPSSICQKLKNLISDKKTNPGQPVLKNQRIKRKNSVSASALDNKCKENAKRPRTSTGASSSEVQTMSENNAQSVVKMAQPKVASAPGIPDQDSHINNPQNVLSRTSPSNQSHSNQNGGRLSRKPPEGKRSPSTKTLILGGEQYEASSLPGRKPSPPAQQKPRTSKPGQVSSYVTTHSTEAKKRQMEEWKRAHVPTRIERRNSTEKGVRTSHLKNTNQRDPGSMREIHPGPSYEPAPRQRHNSQELHRPLMKRAKLEAQQWSAHARKRQASSHTKFVGHKGQYKWTTPVARPSSGSGHPKRPHH